MLASRRSAKYGIIIHKELQQEKTSQASYSYTPFGDYVQLMNQPSLLTQAR